MFYRSSLHILALWVAGIILFSLAVHRGIRTGQLPSLWERTCSYITYPFIRASNAVVNPIHQWLYERALTRDLLTRHTQLQEDYAALQQQYIRSRAASDIYDDAYDLITHNNSSEHKGHIAQIMMRSLSDQSHYYLVDAGSEHGIEPDMVALYKDCLVGRVTHVYPYYCKVVLITDVLCKVAAYCSETKTTGIHEGINSLKATTLRHVSHLAQMQEGDLVLTSGEGLIFPRGFGIGNVASYSHDGLLYTITIKPLVDFETLQYCVLVRRGDVGKEEEVNDVKQESDIQPSLRDEASAGRQEE